MRKILVSVAVLFILNQASAFSIAIINPPLKASEIVFPVGNTGKTISLLELSQIKLKDFETLTGEKMNFLNRLGFKIAQRQLHNSINNDGTFSKKKAEKFFEKRVNENFDSGIGGFALGLFLGPIGVLIAYLLNDEKKRNRVKWAWIGLAVLAVPILLLSILIIHAYG
ncbi:MAG: hypothetical protein ACHQEB_00240 [Chitinophagales bacterium]